MSRDIYEHRHTFEESDSILDPKALKDNYENHFLSVNSIKVNDPDPDKHSSDWDYQIGDQYYLGGERVSKEEFEKAESEAFPKKNIN